MERRAKFPFAWNLLSNPLFRRHARSSLRLGPLISWFVVTQIAGAFFWCFSFLITMFAINGQTIEIDPSSESFQRALQNHGGTAFLMAWLAILVFQGVILIMKGTFSVAVGVAKESSEGMIEAERLTPLPVVHKVTGQLFGLPVIESLLTLSLMPYAFLSYRLGALPGDFMLRVYALFFISALMHHAIGLVAGTLIKQKILAGTLSQILVILLHLVLPFFGGMGVGPVAHLAIEKAILYEVAVSLPSSNRLTSTLLENGWNQQVKLFHWVLTPTMYSFVLVAITLGFLLWMLRRRWLDSESQFLGKIGTTLLAIWVLWVGMGELVPVLRENGILGILPESGNFRRSVQVNSETEYLAGVTWAALVGIVLTVFSMILVSMMTPLPELRRRTLEQIKKDGFFSVSLFADGRNAFFWCLFVVMLTSSTWHLLTREMLISLQSEPRNSHGRVSGLGFSQMTMFLSLVVPVMTWQLMLSLKGWRMTFMLGFWIWIVPLLVSTLGILASARPNTWPLWSASMSGFTLPALSVYTELLPSVARRYTGMLGFGIMLHLALFLFLLQLSLTKNRKEKAET